LAREVILDKGKEKKKGLRKSIGRRGRAIQKKVIWGGDSSNAYTIRRCGKVGGKKVYKFYGTEIEGSLAIF